MGPTGCYRVVSGFAFASAAAAAILLWGVGAEAIHFREYLQGGLLLVNALLTTLLESLTVWQYLEWRRERRQYSTGAGAAAAGSPTSLRRARNALDEYRRAGVYITLSVPCFVHVRRVWLPFVPGAMLLLSAALYASKYCCALMKQRTLVKVPTFVRFKDESVSAELREAASSGVSAAAAAVSGPAEPRLSHQSSFASSHSGRSGQMGSKDSGIEASQRDVSAASAAATAEAKVPRKAKGLVRACSSSPDRCCLINEDSLSLRE